MIKKEERIDDLQFKGLKIIQNPKAFCFGMDAVLLSSFVELRPKDKVVDFGTGTGILPILLYGRYPNNTFHGFEIQSAMADMAKRSILLNQLENQIIIHQADLRNSPKILGNISQDVIICNPPYGKADGTIKNSEKTIALSKHEEGELLFDIIKSGQLLLKHLGRFYLVFPANRLFELVQVMKKEKIEPKRGRMVCSMASKAPYLVLMEGKKGAKPGFTWEKPLIVYNDKGEESEEIKRIYHKTE